jgi:hypothetical protein
METMGKDLSEKWAVWYENSCKALLTAFLELYQVADEHTGIIVKGMERRLQEKYNTAEKKADAVKGPVLTMLADIASSERTSARVDSTLLAAFLVQSATDSNRKAASRVFRAAIRANKVEAFREACQVLLPFTEYTAIGDAVQAYNDLQSE